MNIAEAFEPLRKSLRMIPPDLRMRLLLTAPLNLAVALFESANAGSVYFLVKVVGEPDALHTMWVGNTLRRFVPDATHRTLVLTITAALGLFYFVKVAFTMWATVTSRRAIKRANVRVASMFFRAYIVAPYSVHFRRNSADIATQINRVIPETLDGVIGSYLHLFLEAFVGTALLVTMFLAAPQVTLTLALISGLSLYAMMRWTNARMTLAGAELHDVIKAQARKVSESLGAIKEIKVLGREPHFLDHHAALVEQGQEMLLRRSLLETLPRVMVEAVFAGAGLLSIALYSMNHAQEANVVPLLGLYAYGAFRLIPTSNRVTLALGDLRWRRVTLERIYSEYCDVEVGSHGDVDRSSGRIDLQDKLVFEDVGFKYPGDAPFALREVSFEVQRGQAYGIVGPTGAGKSTVIDLVLGLLKPTEGRICVDGQDIDRLGARWRRSIGYVPQDIYLCDDSVRRNVALGIADEHIDDARVWSALRMAQLEDFVRTLPGELDAEVGERGARLSGGQRQRIGIARALYHDPAVLVFDEATSSLDVTTEAEVTRAIEALLGVKTMIVVAHRLSTVRRCDRLVLLVDGRPRAAGTYEELVRDEPMFRKMAIASGE